VTPAKREQVRIADLALTPWLALLGACTDAAKRLLGADVAEVAARAALDAETGAFATNDPRAHADATRDLGLGQDAEQVADEGEPGAGGHTVGILLPVSDHYSPPACHPSPSQMFDRFTDVSKRVMNQARREAQRLNHNYLGPEHMLLGLLREPGSYGASLLQALGANLDLLRTHVEEKAGPGPAGPTFQMPFAESAKGVLVQSMNEASALGHDQIGSEDLLLGMFKPEDKHIANEALAHFGITASALRDIVKAHPALDEDAGPVQL